SPKLGCKRMPQLLGIARQCELSLRVIENYNMPHPGRSGFGADSAAFHKRYAHTRACKARGAGCAHNARPGNNRVEMMIHAPIPFRNGSSTSKRSVASAVIYAEPVIKGCIVPFS